MIVSYYISYKGCKDIYAYYDKEKELKYVMR